jgi:hypothetical protein
MHGYNEHGNSEPGSFGYYGGGRRDRYRNGIWQLRSWIVPLLLTLGLAELALFGLGKFGLAPRNTYPDTIKPVFWDDIRRDTGVWRYPNAELHVRTRCYDVVYQTNSFGARDRPRTEAHDGPRVVLLGDSMIEGLGVSRENRVSDLLEKKTGVEHLNFATSGSFGPIQQWLIYKNLAQQFDHTAVYLFAFPTNDFVDNDPDKNNSRRYRPYLRNAQGEHKEIFYPVPFEERQLERRSRLEAVFNGLTNRVRIVAAARWAFDQVAYRDVEGGDTNNYSDYTESDLADMQIAYRRIVELAGDRAVYMFLLPFAAEFATLDEAGGYRSLPLASDLAKFADGFDNVVFLDLLEPTYRTAKRQGLTFPDFILGCDGHWGLLGNRIVADAIHDWLQERKAHAAPGD